MSAFPLEADTPTTPKRRRRWANSRHHSIVLLTDLHYRAKRPLADGDHSSGLKPDDFTTGPQ
jgi:hypothetical protein